jgi:hypothetical protein
VKLVAILLLALEICSCGPSKPIITLEMQNHSRAEWILVSVRDTSVILLPTFEPIGKAIAFTHAIVMQDRDIWRIVLHPDFTFLSRMPIALFGTGVGIALKACDCEDRLSHSVIGFAAGWTVGGLSFLLENLKQDTYYPWIEDDRERLRRSAVFPIEPEIMQYIH